jgi:solute carrier family 8 (sodium/calcium exchanger)
MLHPTKEENGEINDVSCADSIMHFLSIGWKVLFAVTNPPPHVGGGYACLVSGITNIGFVTYVVAEVATLFGCIVNLRPGLTAITFVAIGTSLPDTFASMTAARNSRYADEAVGNITGSNCVNVFLGLGLPWLIAAIWTGQGKACVDCALDAAKYAAGDCQMVCAY